jgi:hypothetical protein
VAAGGVLPTFGSGDFGWLINHGAQ